MNLLLKLEKRRPKYCFEKGVRNMDAKKRATRVHKNLPDIVRNSSGYRRLAVARGEACLRSASTTDTTNCDTDERRVKARLVSDSACTIHREHTCRRRARKRSAYVDATRAGGGPDALGHSKKRSRREHTTRRAPNKGRGGAVRGKARA